MASFVDNATLEGDGIHFHDLVQAEPFVGFYLVVTCGLFLLGTCGNTLVIATVLMDRKLHTVSNVFVVNLAIADIGVTGFVDAFTIVGIATTHRFLPPQTALCEVVGSFCLICCICSLWNIMAVSINRYIFICKSHLYASFFTWPKTVALAAAVWICCFLIDLPNFVGWGDHGYDAKTMVCSYSRTASLSWLLFFIGSAVVLPAFVILYCYGSVYIFVHRHALKIHDGFKTNNMTIKRKDIQLMKTLFAIFIVFSVCWVPYAAIVTADYQDKLPGNVHMFIWIMAHGNSAFDSVLYGVMNKQFRYGYLLIFSKVVCCYRPDLPRQNQVSAVTGNPPPTRNTGTLMNKRIIQTTQADCSV